MAHNVHQNKEKAGALLPKELGYSEVVEYLDSLIDRAYDSNVITRMAALDAALGNICADVKPVLVGGTNGKSITMHCAARLFKEEGITSTMVHSSHFLNYNERFISEKQTITNKQFAVLANRVISIARQEKIEATASEILTLVGILYAHEQKTEVLLLEVGVGGQYDAAAYCTPSILAVTRVADDATGFLSHDLDQNGEEFVSAVRENTWFISAEQSKIRLQKMKKWVEDKQGKWSMPIRKLAPLPYMYEQLYGRIASLGERIVQIYVEDIKEHFSPFLRGNLLATEKGQRGRPTLEAKRHAEQHPVKMLKDFWLTNFEPLKGRFELLTKEKPPVLLDNASSLDAFMNVFLGARLLHYQKNLKGFILIMGVAASLDLIAVLKAVRYLFKKVPGELYFIPLPGKACYTPDELTAAAKKLNMRAKAFPNLDRALPIARGIVDERDGLIGITGGPELIRAYWKVRGVKKI